MAKLVPGKSWEKTVDFFTVNDQFCISIPKEGLSPLLLLEALAEQRCGDYFVLNTKVINTITACFTDQEKATEVFIYLNANL